MVRLGGDRRDRFLGGPRQLIRILSTLLLPDSHDGVLIVLAVLGVIARKRHG
jgi:hypothetical protein